MKVSLVCMTAARRRPFPTTEYSKLWCTDHGARRPCRRLYYRIQAAVPSEMGVQPGIKAGRIFALLHALAGANGACIPGDSFTPVSFENAAIVHSNLGGQGGPCTTAGVCDEMQSADTPHEIYLRNVATSPTGDRIDLRITNATEYKASRPHQNGIKDGKMVEITLFGPNTGGVWDQQFTGCDLLPDFQNGINSRIDLPCFFSP